MNNWQHRMAAAEERREKGIIPVKKTRKQRKQELEVYFSQCSETDVRSMISTWRSYRIEDTQAQALGYVNQFFMERLGKGIAESNYHEGEEMEKQFGAYVQSLKQQERIAKGWCVYYIVCIANNQYYLTSNRADAESDGNTIVRFCSGACPVSYEQAKAEFDSCISRFKWEILQ